MNFSKLARVASNLPSNWGVDKDSKHAYFESEDSTENGESIKEPFMESGGTTALPNWFRDFLNTFSPNIIREMVASAQLLSTVRNLLAQDITKSNGGAVQSPFADFVMAGWQFEREKEHAEGVRVSAVSPIPMINGKPARQTVCTVSATFGTRGKKIADAISSFLNSGMIEDAGTPEANQKDDSLLTSEE